MAQDEDTSEPIGSIAARYAHHSDPNVRRMAMSLLTQRPDHIELRNALADAPGAHAYYNPEARLGAVAVPQPHRRSATDTIAGGWRSKRTQLG